MPTGAIIILIIVVWLFVLAPWLLRSQRPVSHTGEAFEDTRVVFNGGSGEVTGTRRPKLRKSDIRNHFDQEDHKDFEVVEPEYAEAKTTEPEGTEQENPEDGSSKGSQDAAESAVVSSRTYFLRNAMSKARAVVIGEVSSPESSAKDAEQDPLTVDGEVVEETVITDSTESNGAGTAVPVSQLDEPADEAVDETVLEDDAAQTIEPESAAAAEVFTAPAVDNTATQAYPLDDSFVSPVDLLYPGAVDSDVELKTTSTAVASKNFDGETTTLADGDAELSEAELSAEDVAFALRRSGRGGWDPVADNAARATRYQRRQRTLLFLSVVVVLSVAAGILFGGWAWAAAALMGAITLWYLVALRNLTLAERALHRRRVAQLRRARLGVRNVADTELAIPAKLRRPGAIVLEADDESPDFEFLPVYQEAEYEAGETPTVVNRRVPRDDLSSRRAG